MTRNHPWALSALFLVACTDAGAQDTPPAIPPAPITPIATRSLLLLVSSASVFGEEKKYGVDAAALAAAVVFRKSRRF